jgi:hypothetical protein
MQDEAPHLPQSDGGLALKRAIITERLAQQAHADALFEHYRIIVRGEKPE